MQNTPRRSPARFARWVFLQNLTMRTLKHLKYPNSPVSQVGRRGGLQPKVSIYLPEKSAARLERRLVGGGASGQKYLSIYLRNLPLGWRYLSIYPPPPPTPSQSCVPDHLCRSIYLSRPPHLVNITVKGKLGKRMLVKGKLVKGKLVEGGLVKGR